MCSQAPDDDEVLLISENDEDVVLLDSPKRKQEEVEEKDTVTPTAAAAGRKKPRLTLTPRMFSLCRTDSDFVREEARGEEMDLRSSFLQACAPIIVELAGYVRGSMCDGCRHKMGNQQGHFDVRIPD